MSRKSRTVGAALATAAIVSLVGLFACSTAVAGAPFWQTACQTNKAFCHPGQSNGPARGSCKTVSIFALFIPGGRIGTWLARGVGLGGIIGC